MDCIYCSKIIENKEINDIKEDSIICKDCKIMEKEFLKEWCGNRESRLKKWAGENDNSENNKDLEKLYEFLKRNLEECINLSEFNDALKKDILFRFFLNCSPIAYGSDEEEDWRTIYKSNIYKCDKGYIEFRYIKFIQSDEDEAFEISICYPKEVTITIYERKEKGCKGYSY